jgi:hypothetical protein
MIVAQHEVLGFDLVKRLVPISYNVRPNIPFVPGGTLVSFFCIISQHFVLGYFHLVPPGRILSADIRQSYVEARWRLRELNCDPS